MRVFINWKLSGESINLLNIVGQWRRLSKKIYIGFDKHKKVSINIQVNILLIPV